MNVINLDNRVIIYIILLILGSCSKVKTKTENLQPVQAVDSLVLKLDNETSHILSANQVFLFNGKTTLASTFRNSEFIKLFDLTTGKTFKTLKFKNPLEEVKGCNGAFFIHPPTLSFILIDDIFNIFLCDGLNVKCNNIIRKKDFGDMYFYPTIIGDFVQPANIKGSVYQINNYHMFRKSEFQFTQIDLNDNTLELKSKVPDSFIDGYFGFRDYGRWNTITNYTDSTIVVNYPNLSQLYIYSFKGELVSKLNLETFLEPKNLKRLVKYKTYNEAMADKNSYTAEDLEYRMKNSLIYKAVLFDEKNRMYYRIVGHPIDKKLLELEDPIKSEIRKYSIITIDHKFNIISEKLITYNKYYIEENAFFVYDGALYLQRKVENEDIAVFDKFTLK